MAWLMEINKRPQTAPLASVAANLAARIFQHGAEPVSYHIHFIWLTQHENVSMQSKYKPFICINAGIMNNGNIIFVVWQIARMNMLTEMFMETRPAAVFIRSTFASLTNAFLFNVFFIKQIYPNMIKQSAYII